MQITLTEQEASALQQLLHKAVQHSGMQVAEACVVLNARIEQARAAEQKSQALGPVGQNGQAPGPAAKGGAVNQPPAAPLTQKEARK